MKASSSKARKLEKYDDGSDKDYSKEEEMGLFIKIYSRYIKKRCLKHSNKNLINFKKSHPHKKEEKKKENSQVTYYKCAKFGHYRTTCLSQSKRNNKK